MLQKKGKQKLPSQRQRSIHYGNIRNRWGTWTQRDIQNFTDELHQVLHDVGRKIIDNGIKPSSAQGYSLRLIQLVNRNEEVTEGQKRRKITVMINVLSLSPKRTKQSDPRIAWFMLHKIYHMYSDAKNK